MAGAAISPFRAKGLVYLGARDFYADRVPGGLEAVSAQLEPRLAEFFTQRFLTGGWYDVGPLLAVSQAAARALGWAPSRLVRENAAWLAERDLRGIYRVILAVASIALVVERLPELSLRYFDFGRAAGRMLGERRFEATRSGIPAALHDWFDAATRGFVPVALEAAGAKNVRVRSFPAEPDGEAHGVALVRMRYHVEWG